MRIAASLLAAAALVALAVPAHAAPLALGRGTSAQAALLREAAPDHGRARVQVLDQLCEDAWRVRRCSPMRPSLRSRLEHAIDRPVTWVSARRPHGPQFWVFEPIDLHAADATSSMAWRDRGRFGCAGGSTLTWRFRHGSWVSTGGLSWIGCPAGR